ncbi:unnamed protein product, partial [Meganyctiphanes norvegica]
RKIDSTEFEPLPMEHNAEQVLVLEPELEVKFNTATAQLKLTNPTEYRICFKLKTTAPSFYHTIPNSGLIEPRQSLTISITRITSNEDQQGENNHKFMIQSLYTPDGEVDLDHLFMGVDQSQVMTSILLCVFDLPLLLLEPARELKFNGAFNDEVIFQLKLTNPTGKRISYRVKTTAPRWYCVRPNIGLVEPHQAVTVVIILQPFDYDPHEKINHKFMVQFQQESDGEVNLDNLFKEADNRTLMNYKLKCAFE